MMMYQIHLQLQSDATFGRGDGVAGLVDQEIEHDAATGLPFLRGRTLKGLLVEECANIFFALYGTQKEQTKLTEAAHFLFGDPGSNLKADAHMRVGAAQLPGELCRAVQADVEAERLTTTDVLESLTAVRRQTAVADETGVPDEGSLRAMRVLLRDLELTAHLDFDQAPDKTTLALLAACVSSLHRAGTGRNRGRGRLRAQLHQNGQDVTGSCLTHFKTLIGG